MTGAAAYMVGGVFAVAAAAALAMLCGLAYRQDALRLRLLRAGGVAPIGSVDGGFVWIAGRVEAAATHASPLSGEPRVYSRWTLEARRADGWDVLARGGGGSELLVRDDTGRARIVAGDATLHVEADREDWSMWSTVPDSIREHVDGPPAYGAPTYRFQEEYVTPGDTVHVFGRADLEADATVAAGYRDHGHSPVFRKHGRREPFYVSTRGAEGVAHHYMAAARFYLVAVIVFGVPLAAVGAYLFSRASAL